MQGLFAGHEIGQREALGPGAWLLRGRALDYEAPILAAIEEIVAAAPFRRMTTPGGFEMSVAMTNCGAAGWITDRRGEVACAAAQQPGPRPQLLLLADLMLGEKVLHAGPSPSSALIHAGS